MKIAGLLNTIDRYGLTRNVVEENLQKAGKPVDLLITDNGSLDERVPAWGRGIAKQIWEHPFNIGNSAAKNDKLKYALEHDYDWIFILDNDIILPENWANIAIQTRENMKSIRDEDAGMIGFSWRGFGNSPFEPHSQTFRPDRVFGSWGAHREVFEKCGYFMEWSKYGLWDSEFNERTKRAGFVNVYPVEQSIHMGHDAHDDPEYRAFKDRELSKAHKFWDEHKKKELIKVDWDDRRG